MRSFIAAFCCLTVLSVTAHAESPNLQALGLGNMQPMSHTQAKAVRGQGAIVWGSSTAAIGPSSSTNGYFAAGKYTARGRSNAYANAQSLDINVIGGFSSKSFGRFGGSKFNIGGGINYSSVKVKVGGSSYASTGRGFRGF